MPDDWIFCMRPAPAGGFEVRVQSQTFVVPIDVMPIVISELSKAINQAIRQAAEAAEQPVADMTPEKILQRERVLQQLSFSFPAKGV